MYKKNFLKQVIAKIDFAVPVPQFASDLPKQALTVIKKRFPVREEKKQVTQQLMFSTAAGVRQAKAETFQFFYHSRDKSRVVTTTAESMLVEHKKYKSFETLQEDFVTSMNAIEAVANGLQIQRFGLRYIDNIEFPKEQKPTDWTKYIQDDLLTSFDIADDRSKICRAFNVLEMNYGDFHLRFQYGMPNPDFPAVIKQKIFVLDYDAFCQGPLTTTEVTAKLVHFHDMINDSFESVIKDGLREKMGMIK